MTGLFTWLSELLSPASISSEDEIDILNSQIYVKQAKSWDCGVACTSMALRWCSQTTIVGTAEEISSIDITPMEAPAETPLWTIDLYCFLRSRGLCAAFSTAVQGINDTHTNLAWYAPHIEADRARVDAKFLQAQEAGWEVDTPVSTAQLVALLQASQCPSPPGQGQQLGQELCAIALVNNKHLHADVRLGGSGSVSAAGYAGHYVLVLGATADGLDIRCACGKGGAEVCSAHVISCHFILTPLPRSSPLPLPLQVFGPGGGPAAAAVLRFAVRSGEESPRHGLGPRARTPSSPPQQHYSRRRGVNGCENQKGRRKAEGGGGLGEAPSKSIFASTV